MDRNNSINEQPLVSVIMNCYNGEQYVREAIDSVLMQTWKNWELIFWDNLSSDSTAEIVKSYDDQRIRYFLAESFDKLGAAREKAIQKASGKYIAFLDSDDRWLPNKINKVLPLFADPEVGLVFSNCRIFDGCGYEKIIYKSPKDYAVGYVFYEMLSKYFLNLQTVVLRTSALSELTQWFDPNFEVSEEADLFLRIAHRWKFAIVDEVLAEYRLHSQSDSWKKTKLFVTESAMIIEKLATLYPDERERIVSASQGIMDVSYWSCAISTLISGDKPSTREYIAKMSKLGIKQYLVYIGTFFPGNFLLYILKALSLVQAK